LSWTHQHRPNVTILASLGLACTNRSPHVSPPLTGVVDRWARPPSNSHDPSAHHESFLTVSSYTVDAPTIQVFGVPHNFSVSDSAGGRFRTQLPFPSGSKFLVTMFDSTGFESGVTIPQALVVGPSAGGSCNATTGGVAFTFTLDAALRQCRSGSVCIYAQIGWVIPTCLHQVISVQRVRRSCTTGHNPRAFSLNPCGLV
jgi:hypothetical protein